MAREIIRKRPAYITKDGDDIKIVFHPIAKNARYPDVAVFAINLGRKNLNTIKRAF